MTSSRSSGEDGFERLPEQPVVVGDEHVDPVRNVDGGLHDGPARNVTGYGRFVKGTDPKSAD
jgi:hypothetical protein